MERCSIRDAALKLQDWFSDTPVSSERFVTATRREHICTPTPPEENNKQLAFKLRA
jgi:hypothetical protein